MHKIALNKYMWDEEMEEIKKVKPRVTIEILPNEDSEVKHLD